MATPFVAVGGRWREIEEQNVAQARHLKELRSEAEVERAALQSSRMRVAELEALAAKFCLERDAEAAASQEFRAEIRILRTQLGDSCEQGSASQLQASELQAECVARLAEVTTLQEALEATRAEARSFRSQLAATAQRLALEQSSRNEANALVDRLKAELQAAEGRLINRGTHVELLLKEKERLWAQLMRARRVPEVKRGAAGDSSTDGPAAKPDAKPAKPRVSSVAVKAKPPEQQAEGVACAPDLERRLWHAMKALERERASHEQTHRLLEELRLKSSRTLQTEPSQTFAAAGA